MPRREPGRAWVLGKYVLLQLPGWCLAGLALAGLVRWWELRPRVAVLLWILWVAKDFLLYPFVRIAYGPGAGGPADALIGACAVAEQALAPDGYVRLGAELWRAEIRGPVGHVPRGTAVRVVAVRGLTLLVDPEPRSGTGPEAQPVR